MKACKVLGALLCITGGAGSCTVCSAGGGPESFVAFAAVGFVGFILFVVGRFGDG